MLFILTSIGFFLWSIRSILFWTSLWQVKEYRLDRVIVHFKETRQGRLLFVSPFFIFSILLVLMYIGIIFHDSWTDIYHTIIFVFFALEGVVFIRQIIQASFKRPALTIKSLAISGLVLLSITGYYALSLLDPFVWMVVGQLLVPLFVAVFVFAFSFPTELYRDYLIQKAQKKLKQYRNLIVIGVSGSVGKTSTKEYLAHVLSKKFSVVKTAMSNNTPIAISKAILEDVDQTTDIFIVEIGSYKKGEVKEICDIIHPSISITTALGEQHISLYGSIDNILATEEELLHALPKNGLALLNANNLYVQKLLKKTKKNVLLYGTTTTRKKMKVSIIAKNVQVEKNGITFTVGFNSKFFRLHTPLLGGHHVENILPAIYLANYLGMKQTDIIHAVQSLTPLQKTMKKFTTQDGVILIDDSFNASPESVVAAATYLTTYSHKKIFVLMPLIELGKRGKEYHYHIGEVLANNDYLFLTNKNFYKDIQEGIQRKNGKCKVYVMTPEKISQRITEIAKKGDVVLFEGKEAGNALTKLL